MDSRPERSSAPRAERGGLSSLGRGGALARSGGLVLGGRRPGTGGAEGPGAGVRQAGSGTGLEMEFDCERLRRLLGKVRAARRPGLGLRVLGAFPPRAELSPRRVSPARPGAWSAGGLA